MMGVTGGSGQVLLLKAGNLFLEFFRFDSPAPAMPDGPPAVNRPGYTHIALDVTDIEALHRRLAEAGMSFNCPPQTGYGVRATYGRDPFGNLIELQQIDDDTHMPRL
jgi:catechol 2,3-dioxygenase-like lactoylglutathione lyase family enzyme